MDHFFIFRIPSHCFFCNIAKVFIRLFLVIFFSVFTVSAPYVALQSYSQVVVAMEDLADDQDSSPAQNNFYEEELEHKELEIAVFTSSSGPLRPSYKPLLAQHFIKDIDRPPSL